MKLAGSAERLPGGGALRIGFFLTTWVSIISELEHGEVDKFTDG